MVRKKRIYLLRHGDVASAFEERVRGGETDATLSAAGLRQSLRNAEFLDKAGVDLVITSGLSRSDFVGIAARHLGIKHEIDRRFAERRFGTWEGKKWTDVRADYPEQCALMDAYAPFLPENGEDQQTLEMRVWEGWQSVLARSECHVAIVGHGFMNVALLCRVQKIPYTKIPQDKGAVSVICIDGDDISVQPNLVVTSDFQLWAPKATCESR